MIIYSILNKLNNKIYIGQTTQKIETRWKKHLNNIKRRKNIYLYDAINHYGIENFLIEKIEDCSNIDELNQRETYWINFYKSNQKEFGYNMTDGGNNRIPTPEVIARTAKTRKDKHGHLSLEHKQAISKANKNKIVSQETRQKISKSLIGRTLSEEHRHKISQVQQGNPSPMEGRHHTKESKLKMSNWRKGKTLEEIVGIEKAKILSKKNGEKWKKEKNPNYVNVSKQVLYNLLKQGYDNQYIANQFKVTTPTIINKTKEYYNKTPSQLRMEFFESINPLTKKKEYKEISLQNVIDLILSGRNRKEITNELGISGWLLNKRLQKKYRMLFEEFKKKILTGEIKNEAACYNSKDK
jgi:hypothetical protein